MAERRSKLHAFIVRAVIFVAALAAGGWALNELQSRGEFSAVPRALLWGIVLVAVITWTITLLTSDSAKEHYWLLKAYPKRMLVVFLLVPMLGGLLAYFVIYRNSPAKADQTQQEQATPDPQLARIEFRTESAKALRNLYVLVRLNRAYTPDELGHFRILVDILDRSTRQPVLLIGCQDAYMSLNMEDQKLTSFSIRDLVWTTVPNEQLQNTVLGQGKPTVDAFDFGANLYKRGPFQTLDDLDKQEIAVFLTEPLIGKISELSVIGNGYILISKKADVFKVSDATPVGEWSQPLSEAQQAIPWRIVYIRDPSAWRTKPFNDPEAPGPWLIDFSENTPAKSPYKSPWE